ncbi:hypothetical protein [Clostridium sp. KNHs214]|nr:hypothetical protein [Clostridium sp. KNHs214]
MFYSRCNSIFWVKNNYDKSKDTLIINADNGLENRSCRIQFIKKLVEIFS